MNLKWTTKEKSGKVFQEIQDVYGEETIDGFLKSSRIRWSGHVWKNNLFKIYILKYIFFNIKIIG